MRLDRLGRSLKELLETVEYLKTHNVGLMSLEEKIDTSSAAGELVFHVFGAIAHFERRLISERTKRWHLSSALAWQEARQAYFRSRNLRCGNEIS